MQWARSSQGQGPVAGGWPTGPVFLRYTELSTRRTAPKAPDVEKYVGIWKYLTGQGYSEKDACWIRKLIILRIVEVKLQVIVAISRVDLYFPWRRPLLSTKVRGAELQIHPSPGASHFSSGLDKPHRSLF